MIFFFTKYWLADVQTRKPGEAATAFAKHCKALVLRRKAYLTTMGRPLGFDLKVITVVKIADKVTHPKVYFFSV